MLNTKQKAELQTYARHLDYKHRMGLVTADRARELFRRKYMSYIRLHNSVKSGLTLPLHMLPDALKRRK